MTESTDSEYYARQAYPRFYDSTTGERLPLNDVLNEHLSTCQICQEDMTRRPKGLGQISRLCFEYQDIIQDWSRLEAIVNNIVAHDEFGNEAPRQGDPNKNPPQWP